MPFYGWPFPYPTEMGYLNVGRVVEVGDEVAEVAVGDTVYALKRHRQEYLLSPDDLFWKLPAELDPGLAVFSYLINLALHALRRAGLVPGETVSVVGLGSIGLAAVMMAHHFGSRVLAVDPVPERRQLAERVGADLVLDPTAPDFGDRARDFGGEPGIDVVVETAGSWPALETAVEIVRQEGRISILALHPGKAEFNPIGEQFYSKQIALVSTSWAPRLDYPPERVRFTLRRNCTEIIAGLTSGALPYETVVTECLSYRDLPAYYARLAAGDRTGGAARVIWD
jgi:threonine dehydrogenase-like Zn-dependent dehydrogenase